VKNLSIRQIASYLSVTKRTIQRRAINEEWPFYEQTGLGGIKRVYAFSSLPGPIKIKVVAGMIAGHEKNHPQDKPTIDLCADDSTASRQSYLNQHSNKSANASQHDWLAQHCFSQTMDPEQLARGFVKAGILSLARLYVAQSKSGKIKGFDQFCLIYNAQEFAIDKAIYQVITRVSRITLLRWEKNGLPDEPSNIAIGAQCVSTDETLQGDFVLSASLQQQEQQQNEGFDPSFKLMAIQVMMAVPTITAKRMREYFTLFFAGQRLPDEQHINQWMTQLQLLGS
jgi:hypothetical protein